MAQLEHPLELPARATIRLRDRNGGSSETTVTLVEIIPMPADTPAAAPEIAAASTRDALSRLMADLEGGVEAEHAPQLATAASKIRAVVTDSKSTDTAKILSLVDSISSCAARADFAGANSHLQPLRDQLKPLLQQP